MSQQTELPPCRLFMIMARHAKMAVIFRRGPSKWTQLIKWDTKTDTFEFGQWFKGRIYEKRCDLSPKGDYLIYFVSKINKKTIVDSEYTYAWTAVSKPPWLTALALWPKGDCWHGGGLFENDSTLMLNHRPNVAKPHPQHVPPRWMRVKPNPEARGEDDPLYSNRLTKDGWQITQDWQVEHTRSSQGFVTKQPEVRFMQHSRQPLHLIMNRYITGYKYYETYKVENRRTMQMINLDKVECACWDQRGRLAFTREGCLFVGHVTDDGGLVTQQIADFNSQQPEEIESPNWARKW